MLFCIKNRVCNPAVQQELQKLLTDSCKAAPGDAETTSEVPKEKSDQFEKNIAAPWRSKQEKNFR
jgi:hypothetical protein